MKQVDKKHDETTASAGEELAYVSLTKGVELEDETFVDTFDAREGWRLQLRPDGIVCIASADGQDVILTPVGNVVQMAPMAGRFADWGSPEAVEAPAPNVIPFQASPPCA